MANNPASVTDPDGGCTTKGGRPCVFSVMGGTATDAGGNIWSGAGDTPSALHTPFALSEVSISKGRTFWDDVSHGISLFASLLEGNSGSTMYGNGTDNQMSRKGDGEVYGTWDFNDMVIPGGGGARTKSNNVLSELANGIKFGVDAAGHGQNLREVMPETKINIIRNKIVNIAPPGYGQGLRISVTTKDTLVDPSDAERIKEEFQRVIDSIHNVYEK